MLKKVLLVLLSLSFGCVSNPDKTALELELGTDGILGFLAGLKFRLYVGVEKVKGETNERKNTLSRANWGFL